MRVRVCVCASAGVFPGTGLCRGMSGPAGKDRPVSGSTRWGWPGEGSVEERRGGKVVCLGVAQGAYLEKKRVPNDKAQ